MSEKEVCDVEKCRQPWRASKSRIPAAPPRRSERRRRLQACFLILTLEGTWVFSHLYQLIVAFNSSNCYRQSIKSSDLISMLIVLISGGDQALAAMEVRPAVRKMGICGGQRPDASSRFSVGKKAEVTLKSGEEEEEEVEDEERERCELGGGGEENGNPVVAESQLPVNLVPPPSLVSNLVPPPRQRLQSTSNPTQQVFFAISRPLQ